MEYLLVLPFVLAYFLKGIYRILPNEVGLITSKGKYTRFLKPGTYFVLPFFKSLVIVRTQDKIFDVPMGVTTNDGIICKTEVKIIFYVDPTEKNISKYLMAGSGFAKEMTTTITNNIFGEVPYKEIAEKRDIISEFISTNLKKKLEVYGIKIRSVELGTVYPPEEIQKADLKIVSKKKEKEASKLQAESIKTKTMAQQESDKSISENRRKLLNEEMLVKISAKEKIKQKEQEIAKLISEDLGKDLKKKKQEIEKIYEITEKEGLAKVLQDE